MIENITDNLKKIFTPSIQYFGEWTIEENLLNIALEKRNKNLYKEFLNRYYYTPLNVIFKDEEITNSFDIKICSKLNNEKRTLYFSKKSFLDNIILNGKTIYDLNGEASYQIVKKAIREKKDIYRDVYQNKEKSKYYKKIQLEFKYSEINTSFEKYVVMCKKRFTKLLTGFNPILEVLNKPLDVNKFIKCFDQDKLYLATCYSLLKHNINHYNKYNRIDFNSTYIDEYIMFVSDKRILEPFYNTSIIVEDNIITIDDLIKEYNQFINSIEITY